jgi:hypothetical protein
MKKLGRSLVVIAMAAFIVGMLGVACVATGFGYPGVGAAIILVIVAVCMTIAPIFLDYR